MKKEILAVILFCLFIGSLATFIVFKSQYPYGRRTCCLPCLMDDLRAYTRWNEGWYPKGGRTALQSLSLLYPEYVKTPAHLAGISGDRDVVVQRLLSGGGLDESACSWVYVPGFRDDDEPVVAIIWEKQPGIRFNGKRGSGRAVGFSDGSHAQVSLGAWAKFLEEQEKLRESALKNRSRGQSK